MVHQYDFSVGAWTEISRMQEQRIYHGCGLVTSGEESSRKRELVVAGGSGIQTVEIYNFQTKSWR